MLQSWCSPKFLRTLLIAISSIAITSSKAQSTGPLDTVIVEACVEPNGDTIPCSWLADVNMLTGTTAKSRRKYADWTRLRNAVYVTYPYAIAASKVMNNINTQLVNVDDKRERKKIIRSNEKLLKAQFTDKLKQLSVYQGKVLMKLIDRQTGNNCYEIIEDYEGRFDAGFWQTVAVVFGSSLRQNYDANGNDHDMEMIVKDVESMYGVSRR